MNSVDFEIILTSEFNMDRNVIVEIQNHLLPKRLHLVNVTCLAMVTMMKYAEPVGD